MATKVTISASTVIAVATKYIGYLEKSKKAVQANPAVLDSFTDGAGSDNYTLFWRELNPSFQGEPYCQCTVNFFFTKAFGESTAKSLLCSPKEWSYYTPTASDYFKKKNQWYTSNPRPGDIIYFKNSSRINHVGLVYKVDSTNVYTIEGNTSSGTDVVIPNGGGVFQKQYKLNNTRIAGYGRPKYTSTAGQTSTTQVDIACSTDRIGLKIVGTNTLNVRKSPDTGKVVKTYSKNTCHQITAYTNGQSSIWFKTADGYISGNYVEGWIKFSQGKWKYITQGAKYLTLVVKEIEGEYYAFDKDGYMITSDRIDSNGAVK